MGFSPAQQPEIAVVVVIDEPQKEHYGGIVAAPIFKEIALKILDYMGIPPNTSGNGLTASLEYGKSG